MLFEHVIINPHLAPFIICFLIAFPLVIFAPIHHMWRKRKIIVTPKDLMKYSKLEKILLISGIVLAVLGILGSAIVTEKYGYNVVVTEIDGTRNVERIKP